MQRPHPAVLAALLTALTGLSASALPGDPDIGNTDWRATAAAR